MRSLRLNMLCLGGAKIFTVVAHQQVRYMSRRRLAYPFYPFKKLFRENPKRHDTNLKSAMRQFLGPRNYRGEYVLNKYFSVPNNHIPNYVKPDLERGQSLRNPNTGMPLVERHDGTFAETSPNKRLENIGQKRLLQPFPDNSHCVTNFMISEDLREQIFQEIEMQGLSTQQVSQKYGLKIARVEAIAKLTKIEKSWVEHKRMSPDVKKMADTVYKMFPLFDPSQRSQRENLSEIPVPEKTLASRFLTIAESEPFGPVDAAKILELEPAVKTLERIATIGEHSEGNKLREPSKSGNKVVYGEVRKGDNAVFKFKQAKVGKVGFRYGSGNRDNRKDRKIGFNEIGQMVYL